MSRSKWRCAASSAPWRKRACSPSCAPASTTRSRPPSASASSPQRSSATTSVCAARCFRRSCTNTIQAAFSAATHISLKQQISEDMKTAMRAKDAARLSAIRLILAAIKQREVDERIELGDPEVLSVLEKMIKQRRESIVQFEKAARTDLADAEKFELQVLSGYLPQQLGEAEIQKEINSESRKWARAA